MDRERQQRRDTNKLIIELYDLGVSTGQIKDIANTTPIIVNAIINCEEEIRRLTLEDLNFIDETLTNDETGEGIDALKSALKTRGIDISNTALKEVKHRWTDDGLESLRKRARQRPHQQPQRPHREEELAEDRPFDPNQPGTSSGPDPPDGKKEETKGRRKSCVGSKPLTQSGIGSSPLTLPAEGQKKQKDVLPIEQKKGRKNLSPDEKQKIIDLKDKKNPSKIAGDFGVHKSTVRRNFRYDNERQDLPPEQLQFIENIIEDDPAASIKDLVNALKLMDTDILAGTLQLIRQSMLHDRYHRLERESAQQSQPPQRPHREEELAEDRPSDPNNSQPGPSGERPRTGVDPPDSVTGQTEAEPNLDEDVRGQKKIEKRRKSSIGSKPLTQSGIGSSPLTLPVEGQKKQKIVLPIEQKKGRKLTANDRQQIIDLRSRNVRLSDIADLVDVTYRTVTNIMRSDREMEVLRENPEQLNIIIEKLKKKISENATISNQSLADALRDDGIIDIAARTVTQIRQRHNLRSYLHQETPELQRQIMEWLDEYKRDNVQEQPSNTNEGDLSQQPQTPAVEQILDLEGAQQINNPPMETSAVFPRTGVDPSDSVTGQVSDENVEEKKKKLAKIEKYLLKLPGSEPLTQSGVGSSTLTLSAEGQTEETIRCLPIEHVQEQPSNEGDLSQPQTPAVLEQILDFEEAHQIIPPTETLTAFPRTGVDPSESVTGQTDTEDNQDEGETESKRRRQEKDQSFPTD